jgi:hypothetical protein
MKTLDEFAEENALKILGIIIAMSTGGMNADDSVKGIITTVKELILNEEYI